MTFILNLITDQRSIRIGSAVLCSFYSLAFKTSLYQTLFAEHGYHLRPKGICTLSFLNLSVRYVQCQANSYNLCCTIGLSQDVAVLHLMKSHFKDMGQVGVGIDEQVIWFWCRVHLYHIFIVQLELKLVFQTITFMAGSRDSAGSSSDWRYSGLIPDPCDHRVTVSLYEWSLLLIRSNHCDKHFEESVHTYKCKSMVKNILQDLPKNALNHLFWPSGPCPRPVFFP